MSNKPEKYTTNSEWTTFREIAEIMSNDGCPMNTTSARNHLYRALEKMSYNILKEYYGLSDAKAKENAPRIARDESFQEIVCDCINS